MTDILYIVGNGAKTINDRPLRWSLRSLEKFATNVGRVIVAGEPPDWLSDEVIKIPCDVTHKGKARNMLMGYRAALHLFEYGKPFLFSSDDHYFCKNMDLDTWAHYHRGWLPTNRNQKTEYMTCLAYTGWILSHNGLSTRNLSLHMNTWAYREDVEMALTFDRRFKNFHQFGFEPACLINAFFEKRMKEAGKTIEWVNYHHDRKVSMVKDVEQKIKDGLPMFTTTPDAEISKEMIDWMYNWLPHKSKYENDIDCL